ncbi:MAG: ATP-binding protein [Clostridia bacterium]
MANTALKLHELEAGISELSKNLNRYNLADLRQLIEDFDYEYGINIDAVKQKAVEEGIVSREQMESLSDNEVLNIIFAEGFSTKEVVNELSGRGIGLSAVLKEIEKLGGKISVSTKAREGTEFCITLPAYKTADLMQVTIEDIMAPLLNTAVRFIGEQLGEAEEAQVSMRKERIDRAELKKYTAFSNVKGILEGRFVLSFDESLAESFAAGFSLDVLPD